jgi:hypothetical protein
MRAKWLAAAAVTTAALAAAGCGEGSDGGSEQLQPGTFEYELPKEYLVENGIERVQAERESGRHTTMLGDGGAFSDSWRTAEGETGACYGTYKEGDSKRVTFRWSSGCVGDWSMTYRIDGDTVTWSEIESFPPASEADQHINEVFNSVPWKRVGD